MNFRLFITTIILGLAFLATPNTAKASEQVQVENSAFALPGKSKKGCRVISKARKKAKKDKMKMAKKKSKKRSISTYI
ncbi:MAG: hypothetical protein NXI20_20610 [bacterium]|jgi:uncharacterized membrane protein|nr:hypothetical protein [bacterium]